ncbi:hypothetical protein KJ652_01740 [Patescibacteria group bacterium]|nr:hypothetical protein [Patescibacteria group bacterium]MBU1123286.1 hypothetical protein [Patescibacteria group bacterium]
MPPDKPPLPKSHAEYDAHLMRASLQGPDYRIKNKVYTDDKTYFNPWSIPWYLKPKIASTAHTTEDFVENTRQELVSAIVNRISSGTDQLDSNSTQNTQCKPNYTSPSSNQVITERDVTQAKLLFQHLPHVIVQNACALHAGNQSIDELIQHIHCDLNNVFSSSKGVFVAYTPEHPFCKKYQTRPYTTDAGITIMQVVGKKPTVPDKKIAKWLYGPTTSIENPKGRIKDILEEACPYLIGVNHEQIYIHMPDLRKSLSELLHEKESLDDQTRAECVEQITDAWLSIVSPRSQRQLRIYSEDDWSADTDDVLDKHFAPDIIDDPIMFQQKRVVLEQLAIRIAGETDIDIEFKNTELDKVFAIWRKGFTQHGLKLCDHPTLGLALLATIAACDDINILRKYL